MDKFREPAISFRPSQSTVGTSPANTLGLACYSCVRMSHNGKSIHVTVVDTGGEGFDLNEPAFVELCGQDGINAGRCSITWEVVQPNNCPGNPNAGGNPAPVPNSGSATSSRCGTSWSDANGKCGTNCVNDGPCSGQKCWADLSMAPCSRVSAIGDDAINGVLEFGDEPHLGESLVADFGADVQTDAAISESEFVNIDQVHNADQFIGGVDFSDFAVAANDGTYSGATDGNIPAWAVALIVLGCLLMIGLFVIFVQLMLLLRR